MRFANRVLKIENTCNPEFISWENLEVSTFQKVNRRCTSYFVTFLCFVICVGGLAGW